MTATEERSRLGCDIGGTFTDFVSINESGALSLEKVLTTPQQPSDAIFEGISLLERRGEVAPPAVTSVVHGTTLVINALIERTGSKCALITTEGFRDILEMRNEMRYDVYDLQIDFPAPLVERALRFGVPERVSAAGEVIRPLDLGGMNAILDALRAGGVESVAICFIHAYANPDHERKVADWLRIRAPDLTLSLSSDVLPRMKEYERTSTTVANAYVKPKVQRYLSGISEGLAGRGFVGAFHVMQSSGGVIEAVNAQQFPVRILESGPAAGVAAARWWAALRGKDDLLCFDMGGTTAKLCGVSKGHTLVTSEYEAARHSHFKKGSGLSINVPVLDLIEIGTGGGSIAHIDNLDLLKVGPRSAGAMPGPACYGRGGDQPTVTDADLMIGYLNARNFLGGSVTLETGRAEAAIAGLARRIGIDPAEAAFGIHEIANESMASAARLHLAERGQYAQSLTMVAYGGAGPLHAFGLASKLGIREIFIPPAAGVMSALGMLLADVAVDRARTVNLIIDRLEPGTVRDGFAELRREAAAMLPNAAVPTTFEHFAEMRFAGQGYNLMISLPETVLDAQELAPELEERFLAQYRAQFGRTYDDVPVELIDLRIVASLVPDKPFDPPRLTAANAPVDSAIVGERALYVPEREGFVTGLVVDRYRMRPGHVVQGPAIVEERETTTFVSAGATAMVDEFGILIITMEA